MSHRSLALLAIFTAVLFALGGALPIHAAQDIVIGLQCDRTGPTQTVGVVLCPGYHDYVDLVNSKGGVDVT
jgi:branched-chain amino acid transport system substrate-binding protein